MRAFGRPSLAVVLPVDGVADIMAFVLDSPMAADVPVHVSGGHLFCFPASEDESMSIIQNLLLRLS